MSTNNHVAPHVDRTQEWLKETRAAFDRHVEFLESFSQCVFSEDNRARAHKKIMIDKANEFFLRIQEIRKRTEPDASSGGAQ